LQEGKKGGRRKKKNGRERKSRFFSIVKIGKRRGGEEKGVATFFSLARTSVSRKRTGTPRRKKKRRGKKERAGKRKAWSQG